jgi:hypothetical protein
LNFGGKFGGKLEKKPKKIFARTNQLWASNKYWHDQKKTPVLRMCWSAEVSFATLAFSTACNMFLWRRNWRNDRCNAIFAQTFSFMQFLEGVVWLDIDGTLGWNKSCSIAIKPTLFAQAGSLAFGYLIEHGTLPLIAWPAIIVTMLAVTVRITLDVLFPPPLIAVGPGGHLLWPALGTFDLIFLACVYPLGMCFPIFFYTPRFHGFVYAFSGPISVVFTALLFSDPVGDSKELTGELGSVWCHIANGYGLLAIILPLISDPHHYIKKKKFFLFIISIGTLKDTCGCT